MRNHKWSYKRLLRKGHRYLGVVLGVQVLLWTVSGIFFSWTNITEIRGDHLRKEAVVLAPLDSGVSLSELSYEFARSEPTNKISSIRVVNVLDENFFEIGFVDEDGLGRFALFDAKNGKRRGEITKQEAERVAKLALRQPARAIQSEYIQEEDLDAHHEYREKPVPAWAVTFEHTENLTVYVSAENGQIQSFRTDNWRVFDFLWMLHTMDFATRDDFNNWTLRVFSALSLLMIVSGFAYFYMTAAKPWNRVRK